MTSTNLRRFAVGAGTIALAASMTAIGFGTANAASDSATFKDGGTTLTRTVSNTTPKIGQTFTVTTQFKRTGTAREEIHNIKDLHNSCLEYVPGSAQWETLTLPANEVETVQNDPEAEGMGHVLVGPANKGDWKVDKGKTGTFKLDYKVTTACVAGDVLTSTFHYDDKIGSIGYSPKYTADQFKGGPSVTVKAADTGNPGSSDDDTTDTGSGNFFGSLDLFGSLGS